MSEWELRERQQREEERMLEAEEHGAGIEEHLQFFPTFLEASAVASPALSFLSFLCCFLRALYHLGTG